MPVVVQEPLFIGIVLLLFKFETSFIPIIVALKALVDMILTLYRPGVPKTAVTATSAVGV